VADPQVRVISLATAVALGYSEEIRTVTVPPLTGDVGDAVAVQGVTVATVERVLGVAVTTGGVVVRVVGATAREVVAWHIRHRPRFASRASATAARNSSACATFGANVDCRAKPFRAMARLTKSPSSSL